MLLQQLLLAAPDRARQDPIQGWCTSADPRLRLQAQRCAWSLPLEEAAHVVRAGLADATGIVRDAAWTQAVSRWCPPLGGAAASSGRSAAGRVLVVLPRALGDLCLSLPPLAALAEVQADLSVLVLPRYQPLLQALLPTYDVHADVSMNEGFGWTDPTEVRGLLEAVLAIGPSSIRTTRPLPLELEVMAAARGISLHSPWIAWRDSTSPVSDLLSACLLDRVMGLDECDRARMRIRVRLSDRFTPAHEATGRIGVVATCGRRDKQVATDVLVRVTRALRERTGAEIVVFRGLDDDGEQRHVVELLEGSVPSAAVALPDLVGELARCHLVVGTDGGLTHLAAVAASSTLFLFGPTSLYRWLPQDERVAGVASTVGCAPCEISTWASCDHRSCLRQVDVEQAVQAGLQLLEQATSHGQSRAR